jgi:hypothetical protein
MSYKDPETQRQWGRAWYAKNAEKLRQQKRDWYQENRDKVLAERASPHGRAIQKKNRSKESYRIRHNIEVLRWAKLNSGKWNAKVALRYAHKLQATPKWLTKEQLEEMKQFYINCPEGYEVDHIYPLQGAESRGLHVPWNLQYLTTAENRSKGNRINASLQ